MAFEWLQQRGFERPIGGRDALGALQDDFARQNPYGAFNGMVLAGAQLGGKDIGLMQERKVQATKDALHRIHDTTRHMEHVVDGTDGLRARLDRAEMHEPWKREIEKMLDGLTAEGPDEVLGRRNPKAIYLTYDGPFLGKATEGNIRYGVNGTRIREHQRLLRQIAEKNPQHLALLTEIHNTLDKYALRIDGGQSIVQADYNQQRLNRPSNVVAGHVGWLAATLVVGVWAVVNTGMGIANAFNKKAFDPKLLIPGALLFAMLNPHWFKGKAKRDLDQASLAVQPMPGSTFSHLMQTYGITPDTGKYWAQVAEKLMERNRSTDLKKFLANPQHTRALGKEEQKMFDAWIARGAKNDDPALKDRESIREHFTAIRDIHRELSGGIAFADVQQNLLRMIRNGHLKTFDDCLQHARTEDVKEFVQQYISIGGWAAATPVPPTGTITP